MTPLEAIMRILVVDDEQVSRKKMTRLMLDFGDCDAVDSGTSAVAVFASALDNNRPYTLVTLDIAMPDMKGTEVLEKIRELEKSRNIAPDNRTRILMVTSHADHETIVQSIKTGCDDYIIKPFTKEIIGKKIRKLNG